MALSSTVSRRKQQRLRQTVHLSFWIFGSIQGAWGTATLAEGMKLCVQSDESGPIMLNKITYERWFKESYMGTDG
jgi:hypothetical protein